MLFQSHAWLPPRRGRLTALVVLFASFLGACTTLPQRGQVVMRDVSFPLRDFRMPSGLRVVVEQDARAPMVAMVAVVGTGGSSDPVGQEGMAHLVEHLAFRSRHEGRASVWTRMEDLGAGYVNAITSLDHTAYQTVAPKESLAALVKLEGLRLSSPLAGVSPEVFAVEREVVRNELRESSEAAFTKDEANVRSEATYSAEPSYWRPVNGTNASLTSITLADAQRFARHQYRPDNITIVIAGDLDLADVEGVLMDNLPREWVRAGAPLTLEPRLPSAPSLLEPETVPRPASLMLLEHESTVNFPELIISWVLPRSFDESSAIQDFVRMNLAQSLWGAERTDPDIAEISTRMVSGTRASMLVVRVALFQADYPRRTAERVLDRVYSTWAQMVQGGGVLAQESDFQALRRSVVTGMVLESEDLLARTTRRAELTHFMLDARAYSRMQKALMTLDGGKLTDFAYKWLQRSSAHVVLVRPGGSSSAMAAAPAVLPELSSETPTGHITPSMLTALSSPVRELTLDNGMEVLLVPRPGLPVVRVGGVLEGGATYGAKPGVAEMARMGAFRESWFAGEPSHWGLHLSGDMRRDHLRFEVAGTSGNIGNMLALLAEQLSSTRTSHGQVTYLQEQVVPWRKVVDAEPRERATRELMRALYGDHVYGYVVTGEDMEKVSSGDVERWIADVYRPANTVVVISGEFDVQTVEPLVREFLGGWKRGPATAVSVPAAPPLPAAAPFSPLSVSRPGASQSRLQVACRLPTATPEAEARYALMAELLSMRTFDQVRSKQGASYGFSARAWVGRGGASHLLVEGVVDSQRLVESAKEVQAAFTTLAHKIDRAELERARSRLLARQAMKYISSAAWVEGLLAARVRGFSPESLARRPAYLQAVPADALEGEFQGCLQRWVVGVVADEGQVRAAFRALSAP
ncbi:M16 family metallopeptidase [Myxococcus stipitatus]|uniref:M16 family metallopeptidase n=1 Tax=Myxococcus stipitatus TaxID=83455 RepID=UPI0030D149C7